jgi:uncharacterized protein YuzE
MRITYDSEVDALSIVFKETTVTTRELAKGISGEYDSENNLVGIEILDVKKQFGSQDTLKKVMLEGVGF